MQLVPVQCLTALSKHLRDAAAAGIHSWMFCMQARNGSFKGRPKALLESLERELYSLDKIRAAAGEKLSPKVLDFKGSVQRSRISYFVKTRAPVLQQKAST